MWEREMKKLVLFNFVFCLLVIFVSYQYFHLKSRKAVAYFYAENYIETNYGVKKENLNAVEINYRVGMGLFDMVLVDKKTDNHYYFEVDLSNIDFSLYYISDNTDVHYENE